MQGKEKSKVAVVPCGDYDEEAVYQGLKQGIDMLGGIGCFAGREERILVKPNFLSPSDADKAIVTHPAVIKGMLRILEENGYGKVTYGDSPGHGSCETASRRIGLEGDCYGAVQANMEDEVLVPFPEGKTAKEFYFAKGAVEADAVINLCKMKTHALERITGAVKNVYGLVCGYHKAAGHVKYPNASIFARMLADIHRLVKPRLHIMDGIVAMEGNGPGSGTGIPMKVLLFSEDPVALDAVFCHLVHLDPEMVPTNVQGAAMGIGTYSEKEIEILMADGGGQGGSLQGGGAESITAKEQQAAMPCGAAQGVRIVPLDELVSRFGNPDFDVDRKGVKKTFLSRYSDMMTSFARRPVIKKDLCVKCGICVEHCPVPGKAVDFRKGKGQPPVYDYSKCIRCYCCQEMCPQHAIVVQGQRAKASKPT